jgi:5-methylthioadenosine/S-adenosylhomocysteine deaminase
VYSGRGSDVRHVVIEGRIVMRDRELLTLDEGRVVAQANVQAKKLADLVQ